MKCLKQGPQCFYVPLEERIIKWLLDIEKKRVPNSWKIWKNWLTYGLASNNTLPDLVTEWFTSALEAPFRVTSFAQDRIFIITFQFTLDTLRTTGVSFRACVIRPSAFVALNPFVADCVRIAFDSYILTAFLSLFSASQSFGIMAKIRKTIR